MGAREGLLKCVSAASGSAGACGSLVMHVGLCVYVLHPSTQNTTSFVSQKARRVGWGAYFRICCGAFVSVGGG